MTKKLNSDPFYSPSQITFKQGVLDTHSIAQPNVDKGGEFIQPK